MGGRMGQKEPKASSHSVEFHRGERAGQDDKRELGRVAFYGLTEGCLELLAGRAPIEFPASKNRAPLSLSLSLSLSPP